MAIVEQGVIVDDRIDGLSLDDHVGLADRVGLRVEFLAGQGEASARVHVLEVVFGYREHAAGASGRVVNGADDVPVAQGLVIVGEEQVDHEFDDFARSEVLTGGFVGCFGELADEFFEDMAHFGVGDAVGVQIDVGELLDDQQKQVAVFEFFDAVFDFVLSEDVPHVFGEGVQVGEQIFAQVFGVADQGGQVVAAGVVEGVLVPGAGFEQDWADGQAFGFSFSDDFQDFWLGVCQDCVEAAQDGEGQDEVAVLVGFEVASEQVGDAPDECCVVAHAQMLLDET